MAGEDAELVRAWFEEFATTGIESVIDHVHPDFEGIVPPTLSIEPDTYRGREGIRRYIDSFYEVMDEIRFVPEEFIEVEDSVVVPMRVVAKGKETGIEVEQFAVQVWTLENGKALRIDAYSTREQALEALGAS
jgi:ketosteroid isomerase-like protein